MKLQSVNVHPEGPGEINVGPPVETRPLSAEPTGSVTVHPGSVEREATVFNLRASGEDASNRTRDMLSRVPAGDAKTMPAQDTLFTMPAAFAGESVGPLHAEPGHGGVYRDDRGQAYIRQGGQTFAVKYDADNGTWRVFSPDNPAKYAYPVKQGDSGNWRVHSDVGMPGGLRGTSAAGGTWGQYAVTQLQQQVQQLQNQRQQLQQQRQHLQSQLQQFPGSQHSNRSPAELAQLQGMLHSQLGNVNNQFAGGGATDPAGQPAIDAVAERVATLGTTRGKGRGAQSGRIPG